MRPAALLLLASGCILHPEEEMPLRGTEYYSGVITAIDARTGFPLEGVLVTVYSQPGPPLWTGTTDGVGRVRFSMTSEPAETFPDVLTMQLTRRGYAQTRALFRPDDFLHSASGDRFRSRKAVELRPGRGSEKVDLRGAAEE